MSASEIENYLAMLVRLLPIDSGEREEIRDELRSHLEDRYEDLISQKVPHDEALRRAIDELGDAACLAAAFASLNRTQRRRHLMRLSSATLVVAVLALLAFTAFWPTHPAGGPAMVRAPLGPTVVHAQTPPPVAEQPRSRQSEIQQKLSKAIDAEFVETPLADVLAYLAETLQIQFHVNRRAFGEASIDSSAPIDISLKQVKAETMLRLALRSIDPNLDFVERDGFILVSTIDDLDQATEVRVYNCRDLLSLSPPLPGAAGEGMPGGFGGGPSAPMGMTPAMTGGMGGGGMVLDESPRGRLMSLIMSSVESNSWDHVGGVGSISEFNGLLVVKQSGRVHEKVDELLQMLRKAADLDQQNQ